MRKLFLVNGSWNVCAHNSYNSHINAAAEMHNVSTLNQPIFNGMLDSHGTSNGSTDSGIEADCISDSNLSWLLNYKINELPPVPGDTDCVPNINFNIQSTVSSSSANGMCSTLQSFDKHGDGFKDGVLETNNSFELHPYNNPQSNQTLVGGIKKPPFTYTELIEHALSVCGELTVSGLYQWISENFPFYRNNDDRWKNSVRHNLSINPHFRKGGKAVHGAGHLWTLAQLDDRKNLQTRQRIQQYIDLNRAITQNIEQQEQEAFERELQAATASILGELDESANSNNPNIQVEYINVVDGPNTDGMIEVSKQELAQEFGLGSDYLVTDLNPTTLGLNLSEVDATDTNSAERTFLDDIPFEYYELEPQ